MTKTGATPSHGTLSRMQDALRHRGPDGEGRYTEGAVGLVHTRLSIIDTETGQQPIVHPSGPVLVANGEIYNDLDIRSDLKSQSYQTRSDNESALQLYVRHGLDFVHHLRGMYALAIFDPSNNQLILARDPFGIKPLYYADTPEAFWFASEPQALLFAGVVDRRENPFARDQLLGLQFTCGFNTAFEGIFRLLPGELVVIESGRIVVREFCDPLSGEPPHHDVTAKDFERLWVDAVDVHRRSDVPYGVFLSSGTDSAAILTAMARLEERPVLTFTAGFSGDTVHDERKQAARLASSLGASHTAIEISAEDLWNHLPAIANTLDDPVADYAALPTFLLAEEASKSVKVVLTGEGGDEVFAGYGRYRAGRRPWPFRKTPWARHILQRSGVLRNISKEWRADIKNTEHRLARPPLTELQRLQALDMSEWLPNDLLTKVDRCLMAHGVEGRVPFLDGSMASFGFHLPDSEKVRGKSGKHIVRRWLQETTPVAQPFERKKGFSVPVGAWIQSESRKLAPLVARQPGVAACCKPDAVETLFKSRSADKALAVWVLLFYALWHHCHILGIDAGGTVFDVLAERNSG